MMPVTAGSGQDTTFRLDSWHYDFRARYDSMASRRAITAASTPDGRNAAASWPGGRARLSGRYTVNRALVAGTRRTSNWLPTPPTDRRNTELATEDLHTTITLFNTRDSDEREHDLSDFVEQTTRTRTVLVVEMLNELGLSAGGVPAYDSTTRLHRNFLLAGTSRPAA